MLLTAFLHGRRMVNTLLIGAIAREKTKFMLNLATIREKQNKLGRVIYTYMVPIFGNTGGEFSATNFIAVSLSIKADVIDSLFALFSL